jgi:hypothetical protein
MSKRAETDEASGRVLFQTAFEQLAPDFPFNLAPGATDRRMVGAVLVPAAHSSQDVTAAALPTSIDESDEEQIRALVGEWETLHPDEIKDKWKEVLTDPFVAIGPGWIKSVNDQYISDWQASQQYADIRQRYLPFFPRKTKVSEIHVTFIGSSLASVNYRADEETQNNRGVGNGAALVMKTSAGWRIAAVARFDELVGPISKSGSGS